MPDPFRLRVLKALTTRFEEIGIADGYDVDMVDRVFRGRLYFGEDDLIPMISILEDPISPDSQGGPRARVADRIEWPLMVQGFCSDDRLNPTDPAHSLLAHVKKKLAEIRQERGSATGLLGFGKKAPIVDAIDWSGGVVRPPDETVSAKAYFWLRLTLTLVEDHEDPFA